MTEDFWVKFKQGKDRAQPNQFWNSVSTAKFFTKALIDGKITKRSSNKK